MKLFMPLLALLILAGCTGRIDYVRPSITAPHVALAATSKIIEKSRESIWNKSIPALAKSNFVINQLDKSSGLISLGYHGNPGKYLDCGRVISYVNTVRGERVYDFAGASNQQQYDIIDSNGLYHVQRRLSLETRINLVLEEIASDQTRITIVPNYNVQRQILITAAYDKVSRATSDSISFSANDSALFAPNKGDPATECFANGALVDEVMSLIH